MNALFGSRPEVAARRRFFVLLMLLLAPGLCHAQTSAKGLAEANPCAINHQVYVRGGGCYATIQAGMTACLADSQCSMVDASGMGATQTNTGTLTVGSNTQAVELRLAPGILSTSGVINISQFSGVSCASKAGMSRGIADFPGCFVKQANGANLSAVISLNGPESYLQDVGCDGNSTNNPTAGACILVNKAPRTQLSRVNAQNSSTHGIYVLSTSANESCCFKWDHIMAEANRASGILSVHTADAFVADSEIENNGSPSGALKPGLTVTVSSGTAVSITSGYVSTDSSLLQNWVRIGTTPGCLAKILSIASTTSLTLDRSCTNGAGQQMTYGSGIELLDSSTWRINHVDVGGNQKGLFGSCDNAAYPQLVGMLIKGGTQFGNQVEEDIHVEGVSSCAAEEDVDAEFIGSSFNPDAIYSQIFLNNTTNSKIEFIGYSNVSPHRNTFPISIRETNPGFATNNWVHLHGFPNNYSASFSVDDTGAFPGVNIVERSFILANGFPLQVRDSARTPQNIVGIDALNNVSLLGHPTQKVINLQGNPGTTSLQVTGTGVGNAAGLQSFNTATTCTTAASVGATCTTASINLPVGYNDTDYRVNVTGLSPTSAPVVQTITKANGSFKITIVAITAAAASFASFDCTVTHN